MTLPLPTPSPACAPSEPSELLGSTSPRLWTPPLRELTPEATYGHDVIAFARDVLGAPLDPWQQWLVVHAGELLADGRPRFRVVLVLVARQNGKTHLLVILSLYWLFVELHRMVLGTSSKIEYAKEPWEKALSLARAVPWLAREIARVRRANGEQELTTVDGGRYKIAASNEDAGRSLTVERLILDELRRHTSWAAYNAAIPTMNAVHGAQAWALSNQGGDEAIVLHALRAAAVSHLNEGGGDPTLGIFEWSMPYEPGAALPDPTDLAGLAQANPNLGRRIPADALLAQARRARNAGGEELTGFLTEIGCVRVQQLNPALDPTLWEACREPGTLDGVRDRVALCLDVSLDGLHACVVAAAVLPDGRVRVEPVAAWTGPTATAQLRRELLALVRRVRPRTLGWFPGGPAAVVAAEMATPADDAGKPRGGLDAAAAPTRRRPGWPRGVAVAPIRAEATAACMGLVDLVVSRQLAHAGDPMITTHVLGAERLAQGDAWRFSRRGGGHCDGAYATAGAAHLARTLPPPPPRPRLVVSRRVREARERQAAQNAGEVATDAGTDAGE
ncbi:MAG: terminase [Pseudonocardia sp.]|nr:terminase [Pseudonocardia sp.]